HPTPRIPAQPHWSRSVIGIAAVVALMVIVPILASMLSTGPTGPSSIIQIDGNFGDWSNQRSYGQAFSGPVGNPSVHLVAVKVATQDRELFVYARVQGLMFQGSGVSETYSIFVLVYAADNLGNFNPADGSIRANLPTLIVGQQLVAQDIVASPAVPFLRVTLAPMGGAVYVNGVNVTRRGTSADPVSLALYRDDG